jgi:uncharacterized repeat protein (TIGR01451 family)
MLRLQAGRLPRTLRRIARPASILLVAVSFTAGPQIAHAGSLSADLETTITDSHDPVRARHLVDYRVTVANHGPGDATSVEVRDEIPAGSSFNSRASSDECFFDSEAGVVFCNIGFLGAGTSATVDIVVRAPDVGEPTKARDSASASASEPDPNPDNNSAREHTLVNPSATKTIPPEGGSISTNTGPPGPDPDDPSVLRMVFGPGPGGVAKLTEFDCPQRFTPCIGNAGNFEPPAGYDELTAVFLEDASIVPDGTRRRDINVFYKKPPGRWLELQRCHGSRVPPCIMQVKQQNPPSGPWRIRVLINSDPRLLPR